MSRSLAQGLALSLEGLRTGTPFENKCAFARYDLEL